MGQYLKILDDRKRAREELATVMDRHRESSLVIHYSCESFRDRTDGKSSRITSIAVRNMGSGQTLSFSIHQAAECKGLGLAEMEKHYDMLEHDMLHDYFGFVRSHQDYKWLHWNMRDIGYGFSALEHRFRVLKGDPLGVPDQNKHDLAILLKDIYGHSYADDPRMINVVKMNNIGMKDFLSGNEEAEAFEKKEYIKMHRSTLRKVRALSEIAERAHHRLLATKKDQDRKWLYLAAGTEYLHEHWAMTLLALAVVAISALSYVKSGVVALMHLFGR